ncbi:hypothetical protein PFICI_11980 [Pestalotiopsis fici W106-1]|uniref:Uncharacterized protein n=1 Tax=Pestalotiopsis fici (strain W106-1 / CGMCC3.15140) TaxID=1229662 RepID=W3WRW4_PESFW|nr:uncharacterized protein PFICI_11980 [Pestalotiopsis fici W106-1]ETS76593.1 hypothetical protein PFICI_11980 [Pestalotiopsis fici W106-1]
MRGRDLALDVNGFCCIQLETHPNSDDPQSQEKFLAQYFPLLTKAVKDLIGAKRVQIFNYEIRKRHPDFRAGEGGDFKHMQPAAMAHIDGTLSDSQRLVQKMNPDHYSALSKYRCQVLKYVVNHACESSF